MSVTAKLVRIDTGGPDEEGCLIFVDGRLAAVLVRLSEQHGPDAGRWFYETGFGRFEDPTHPLFSDVESAEKWIEARLNHSGADGAADGNASIGLRYWNSPQRGGFPSE